MTHKLALVVRAQLQLILERLNALDAGNVFLCLVIGITSQSYG